MSELEEFLNGRSSLVFRITSVEGRPQGSFLEEAYQLLHVFKVAQREYQDRGEEERPYKAQKTG